MSFEILSTWRSITVTAYTEHVYDVRSLDVIPPHALNVYTNTWWWSRARHKGPQHRLIHGYSTDTVVQYPHWSLRRERWEYYGGLLCLWLSYPVRTVCAVHVSWDRTCRCTRTVHQAQRYGSSIYCTMVQLTCRNYCTVLVLVYSIDLQATHTGLWSADEARKRLVYEG